MRHVGARGGIGARGDSTAPFGSDHTWKHLEMFLMEEMYHFSELLLQWKSIRVSRKGCLVL